MSIPTLVTLGDRSVTIPMPASYQELLEDFWVTGMGAELPTSLPADMRRDETFAYPMDLARSVVKAFHRGGMQLQQIVEHIVRGEFVVIENGTPRWVPATNQLTEEK